MRAQNKSKRRAIVGSAAILAALAAIHRSDAASFTWDGGSTTSNNLTDAINWSTDIAPPNDGTADLFFTGTTRLAPNVDTPYSISTLFFSSAAGNLVIGGTPISLPGG